MSSAYTIQSYQLAEGEVEGIESVPMSIKDDDITLAMVMQHMQAMEGRLGAKIDDVRTELKSELSGVKSELKSDIHRVERKVDLALMQIGNIDARVDDIEVVQVPKLEKAVGMK